MCVFMRRNVLWGDLNAKTQRRRDAEKKRKDKEGEGESIFFV